VSGDEDAARLAREAIVHPLWRIVRQQSTLRRQRREWIARFPEQLRGLARAQLAAVPDNIRLHAAFGGGGGEAVGGRAPHRRERTHRVDVRTDGVTVVNENQ
jgi:hypothetical protein